MQGHYIDRCFEGTAPGQHQYPVRSNKFSPSFKSHVCVNYPWALQDLKASIWAEIVNISTAWEESQQMPLIDIHYGTMEGLLDMIFVTV